MDRFTLTSKILITEDNRGEYVLYKDYIKELTKCKLEIIGSKNLCESCNKNKTCNPHNNYGIIAIECNSYKQRKK